MIKWDIQHFAEVTSTQDHALAEAHNNVAQGLVILADTQTKGRGRSGNGWTSFDGNLFCSILLRPRIEATQAGQYSFLTAIALNRTLSEMIDDSHTVLNKWPNDVLIDNRKVAGILLEAVLDSRDVEALIIGMGVNIANAPEDKISVNALTPRPETALSFLNAYLAQLGEVLDEYDREGFSGLREEWLDHAFGLSHSIKARLPHETLEGVFEGLETDGAMRLRLANGDIKVIHSAEVFFE